MKPEVIDASVFIALYFDEEYSLAATRWFHQIKQPMAPDLIWIEAASAIWKRRRKKEISEAKAHEILLQMRNAPLRIKPGFDLFPTALTLAMDFDRTVYDSLYLALALETKTAMVTNDIRLVNSLKGTTLERHVVWIGKL